MRAAIIPVDTEIYKKIKDDETTPIVKKMMTQINYKTEMVQPVPNDKEVLRQILAKIADSRMADVVFTIGGVGCREEDWTMEATKAVLDKEIPGIGESMRMYMTRTRKRAMLIRATAGVRGKTLFVNLPANPKTAKECLEYILPEITYAAEVINGEHDDIYE